MSSVLDISRDKVTNILRKRESERQECVQKRKDEKKLVTAENENYEYFTKEFSTKKSEIESMLNLSDTTEQSKLADHFNLVVKRIHSLEKYVGDSNIFLRSYDVRVCNEALQELNLRVKTLEEKLLPKKKFGFKTKRATRTIAKVGNDHEENVDKVDFSNYQKNDCDFKDRNGEQLKLLGDEILQKDVALQNLEKCVVKLFGSPNTLHMANLKECTILSGPVATSVFVENCSNCKFVLACQQLRLHSSSDCDIYLHVTCRAIMEDSTKIRVAPYNLKYESLDDDYKSSGLDQAINHWDSIDDFCWLVANKQSPNWNILDETERIDNWDVSNI